MGNGSHGKRTSPELINHESSRPADGFLGEPGNGGAGVAAGTRRICASSRQWLPGRPLLTSGWLINHLVPAPPSLRCSSGRDVHEAGSPPAPTITHHCVSSRAEGGQASPTHLTMLSLSWAASAGSRVPASPPRSLHLPCRALVPAPIPAPGLIPPHPVYQQGWAQSPRGCRKQ